MAARRVVNVLLTVSPFGLNAASLRLSAARWLSDRVYADGVRL